MFFEGTWQNLAMPAFRGISRRHFLITTGAALWGRSIAADEKEPIIDIHQHTGYLARPDEDLVSHQRAMGVTKTILLPAGTPVARASTHQGKSNGLAAKCGGNESAMSVAKANPGEFFFGANEVTDLETAHMEVERYLKLGAKLIGEQKFSVQCDSVESRKLYELAQEYNVPILLHFQHATYNLGIERFDKVLA
ncbi:MAG: amidohydrolase 2, partial [Chthoniobacteraceae bacterium]|nr:amidohydrolase 2 [Chthoniobacteraceae bacterium]